MERFRFGSITLLGLAVLVGCGDASPPLDPAAATGPAELRAACETVDDAAARIRTVSAGCRNSEVGLPEGWTLQATGGAALTDAADRVTHHAATSAFSPIENPDSAYVEQTRVIDLSALRDFDAVGVIGDGLQSIELTTGIKLSVPNSWATWSCPPHSESCTPHVLATRFEPVFDLQIREPVTAFGFELAPDPLDTLTYTAEFFSGGERVGSVTRLVSGDGGARLFAATTGGTFDRVVVSGPERFAIARVRYALPATPPPTGVTIENVYSGDPARDPGTIALDDQFLYVEILDVERHLGRAASAEDVRIGPNFVAGTPAASFEILDIDRDGTRDIRLRWSLQRLRDEGRLHATTSELTVWGRAADTGVVYRGDARVRVDSDWVVLHDNGGFVTHPGAGAAGADVHLSYSPFVVVAKADLENPGPHFRIADRFTVRDGGWTVTELVARAVQFDVAMPTWTSFDARIWDGRPGDPGSAVLATVSDASVAWTGAYAIRNGFSMSGTDMRIFEIRWQVPALPLPDGEYWVDWQVDGAPGWAIFVTLPNPAAPGSPILPPGVARHLTPAGWGDPLAHIQFPPPHNPRTPFLVVGQPIRGEAAGALPAQPFAGSPGSVLAAAAAPSNRE